MFTVASPAGHRQRHHFEDPGRDSRRTGQPHQPAQLLRTRGNLPARFAPLVATTGGATGPAHRCTPEPTFSQVPDLRSMTGKAIDLLSRNAAGKRKGFFLQVEDGSTLWSA